MIAWGDAAGWCLWAAAVAACVGLRALYAGLETGVYVLNKVRLDLRAGGGSRPARHIRAMLEKPNNLLAVLLIGTNLAGYLATFAITMMFLQAGAGGRTQWYTVAAATPVLFIFGESVPKNVFQRLGETLVYRCVGALRISSMVFNACGLSPLVRGVAWLLMRLTPGGRRRPPGSRQSLSAIMTEGAASGVLTHSQTIMVDRVMHIGEVSLGDAMIPISRVAAVGRDVTREHLLSVLEKHSYSRLLVLDDRGRAVGVLNIYDVLTDESVSRPADAMRPAPALPPDMSVTDALFRMQQANCEMGVVEDAKGFAAGIVTIKDLVEEIVGELEAW